MNLEDRLSQYSKSDMYPFHMPGHKRNMLAGQNPYAIDMTEVEGIDDLHDPEEVIKSEQERIAKLYGSQSSYILVGGSTVGNLAAIYAVTGIENSSLLIQRNSHKSVYNGATLAHCQVDYVTPDQDQNGIYQALTLEQIKEAVARTVERDGCPPKAMVITSPSYEGYHAPVKKIWEYCQENNIILIVDQAHGAHLGFHEIFKESAADCADICIQSLHKTLPALTQTALLHVNGQMVDRRRLRDALDIFETSSPSYVLMNSVSHCMNLLENRGQDLFDRYVEKLRNFYKSCGKLRHLKLLEEKDDVKDPGKIVILTGGTGLSGIELARILREKYHLETEMASFSYVLAMTSIMDTDQGFDRLCQALLKIDESLTDQENSSNISIAVNPVKKMELWQVRERRRKDLELKEVRGHVSAAMVCIYPPGAPILVPGEEVTKEALDLIEKALSQGLHVTGLCGQTMSVVN